MDFQKFVEENKTMLVIGLSSIVLFTAGYMYVQSVYKDSEKYEADRVIESNVSFDEKVDFDDVYNKHSFDKDTTDNAAKRIRASFLEEERKKELEQQKLKERQQFVMDSIRKASLRIQEELKQKERNALLARKRRRSKPKSQPKPQVVVVKKEENQVDDDGFITDFGESTGSSLESDFTNEVTVETQPNSKTLYWVNFSIVKSQTVKSGTIVMFENQEDLKIGKILIPAFSKLQTRATLSGNRCKFSLQKILTEKAVYSVSGDLYDHNRTPGVAVNIKSDNNALLDGISSISKNVIAQSDPTNLANSALDVSLGKTDGTRYAKLNQNLEVLVNITIK